MNAKNTNGRVSESRAKVLEVLTKAGKAGVSVAEAAAKLKVTPHNVYHHLWVLRKEGVANSFETEVEEGESEVRFALVSKGKAKKTAK
jgi:predicted ArsR family transcriptional regulator